MAWRRHGSQYGCLCGSHHHTGSRSSCALAVFLHWYLRVEQRDARHGMHFRAVHETFLHVLQQSAGGAALRQMLQRQEGLVDALSAAATVLKARVAARAAARPLRGDRRTRTRTPLLARAPYARARTLFWLNLALLAYPRWHTWDEFPSGQPLPRDSSPCSHLRRPLSSLRFCSSSPCSFCLFPLTLTQRLSRGVSG
eukprot:5935201-Pleurochrysis_carterae.AAC.1